MSLNEQLVGKNLLEQKRRLLEQKNEVSFSKNSKFEVNNFTSTVKNKKNFFLVEKEGFKYFKNDKKDLGNYLIAAEEFSSMYVQDAIKRLKYVIKNNPDFEAAHSLFIRILLKLDLWKGIGKVSRSALKYHPNNQFFLNIFARHLIKIGEKKKALKYYERCIELNPKSYSGWLALGNCHYICRNLKKANFCLEQSKKIDKFMTDSAIMLECNLLQADSKYDEAMKKLNEGLQMFPLSKQLTISSAITNLKLGNKEEGFRFYNLIDSSRRTNLTNLVDYKLKSKCSNPKEEISKLKKIEDIEELNKNALFSNKKYNLLVLFEQGFGDYLHFYRYLQPLLKLGNSITALGPNLSVFSLLKYSINSKSIKFLSKINNEDLRKFDYKTFIMNVPFLLGNINDIPPPPSFNLKKIRNDKKKLSKRLKNILDKNIINIGVSWKGNKEHISDISRSIKLRNFSKIFDKKDCKFFVVDKNLKKSEKKYLSNFKNVVVCDDFIKDWADTAMIVLELDQIITVDTSLAHISGTLCKPTKILVAKDPDWRWGINGKKTEWYNSVEIIRQSKSDCWKKELNSLSFK